METPAQPKRGWVDGMWEKDALEVDRSRDLDFTDKLKALRELIASSRSHGHADKGKHSSRIMVRRSARDLEEAKEVGDKVQFSANSFGRRELGQPAGTGTGVSDREILAGQSPAAWLEGRVALCVCVCGSSSSSSSSDSWVSRQGQGRVSRTGRSWLGSHLLLGWKVGGRGGGALCVW